MTSFKGMDELFWGWEFEDVIDQVERLEMVAEMQNYDEIMFFKIACLNMRGKAQEWYKKFNPTLVDQVELKIAMELKYGNVNLEGIQVWFNVIKQEPKQRVQSYYDRLEILFSK